MKLTPADWENFLKVSNPTGNSIKGALCKGCKRMITTVTRKRLEAHRKCCPANTCANYRTDNMDTDDDVNEDLAELRNILDHDLGLFFYSESLAFRKVENVHLKRFIRRLQTFNANYEPPSRSTLGGSLLDKVHDSIESKKKIQLEETDGVLLVDGWRNKSANRKYLVFSVRNINTPQTFLTFYDTSIEKEDGQSLSERIDAAIEIAKEKYECNVNAIISDNDSKIVLGAKLAKEKTLIRSSCSSHSGNLLIKLFVTKELMDSLREILTIFREPKLEALLIKKGGTRLQNFPDTRFCYLRDTCESILVNLKFLKDLSSDKVLTVSETVSKKLHDEGFKTQLISIVEHLNPICALINSCQNPKCNVADATEMWLSLQLPTNNYDQAITERIKKAVHPVGYAANLLHHKYKGQLLDEDQRNSAHIFLNSYLNDEAKHELFQYLDNPELYKLYSERLKDPVAFWLYLLDDSRFHNLAEAAVKLMIIPASTALLEGLFSNWSYVHNLYRNRLGHVKSSKLLDIYYSLKNNLYNEDLINDIMVIEDDEKSEDNANLKKKNKRKKSLSFDHQ